MQIGQRLGVIEPAAFRHEAFEQLQHAIGAIDEAAQQLSCGSTPDCSRPS
jgi:hypothetical protein